MKQTWDSCGRYLFQCKEPKSLEAPFTPVGTNEETQVSFRKADAKGAVPAPIIRPCLRPRGTMVRASLNPDGPAG